MTGHDDMPSGHVQAAVTFVGGGLAEEHAGSRMRGEFVGSRGTEVGVAEAVEHTEGRVIQELLT